MTSSVSGVSRPEILPLPAFSDNYIWAIRDGRRVAVVDPGDPAVVEAYLESKGLDLTAILITHHHSDHTGGILALTAKRDIPVYGPVAHDIAGVTIGVAEGDEIRLSGPALTLTVMEVPGHTRTHIAYYSPGLIFPGDTLFSAGCGRLLGGTAEQLHHSLERLKALPGDTRVYCTHEYTLSNLAFAQAAEPDNPDRDEWLQHCRDLRARGLPTLPSSIALECRINPFLRVDKESLLAGIGKHLGQRPLNAQACFTELRVWKDSF